MSASASSVRLTRPVSAPVVVRDAMMELEFAIEYNRFSFPASAKYSCVVVACSNSPSQQIAWAFSLDENSGTITTRLNSLPRGGKYHAIAFHFFSVFNPYPSTNKSSESLRRVGMCIVPLLSINDNAAPFKIITERGWPAAKMKSIRMTKAKGVEIVPLLHATIPSIPEVPIALQSDIFHEHASTTLKGVTMPMGLAISVTAFGQPSTSNPTQHLPLFRAWLQITKSSLRITKPLTLEILRGNAGLLREFVGDFFSTPFRGLVYSGDFVADPRDTGRFVSTEEWCPLTFMPKQEHACFDCEDCAFTVLHILQAFDACSFDADPELKALKDALSKHVPCFAILRIRENVKSTEYGWHGMVVFADKRYLLGKSDKPNLMFVDATHALQHDLARPEAEEDLAGYETVKDFLDENAKQWPVAWRLTAHLKMPASVLRKYNVYGRLYSLIWVDKDSVWHSICPPTESLLRYFKTMDEFPRVVARYSAASLRGQFRSLASPNPPPRLPSPPSVQKQHIPPLTGDTSMRIMVKAPVPAIAQQTLRQINWLQKKQTTVTQLEVFAGCQVELYDYT